MAAGYTDFRVWILLLVKPQMRVLMEHHEIFQSVVEWIPVDMVNMFMQVQSPT
jgi:hypothetical protein